MNVTGKTHLFSRGTGKRIDNMGGPCTDKHLDKHEEYVVRKIADLIYVEHKDFIEAKLRVKKKLLL
jgi:hypothetical protein